MSEDTKVLSNIRKMMEGCKEGLKCWQLRDKYFEQYGKYYSESGFSARLREIHAVCDKTDRRYTYTLPESV